MYISCLMLFVCLLQLEKGRGCLVFMKHGKVLKILVALGAYGNTEELKGDR